MAWQSLSHLVQKRLKFTLRNCKIFLTSFKKKMEVVAEDVGDVALSCFSL